MPDARDLVIETLAESEAALRDQVVRLEREVEAYRELAQQAIHALHEFKENARRHDNGHEQGKAAGHALGFGL